MTGERSPLVCGAGFAVRVESCYRRVRSRPVCQNLLDFGWLDPMRGDVPFVLSFHSQKGGHRQFVHPVQRGRVTAPGDDLAPGTLRCIFNLSPWDCGHEWR
jgi:hypothetical protein